MESSLLPQLHSEGKGKEEVKEANGIGVKRSMFPALQQQYQVEDKGKGEMEHGEDASITIRIEPSVVEQELGGTDYNDKERGEKQEATEGKMEDISSKTEILDSTPIAESSTAQKQISEDKDKIEYCEGTRMAGESSLETGPIEDYAHLLERVDPKFFIHKVHSGLRDGSAKHYEPALLSIGPYHYGKTPLQDMERHKVHYLQLVLHGRLDESSTEFIEALESPGSRELKALDCYVDTFQMKGDEFQKCMVRDGFFMIGLFLRNDGPLRLVRKEGISKYDMLFDIKWMKPRLARDLLLFENQIPLFVLRRLLAFTEQKPDEDEFFRLALGYFEFNGRLVSKLPRIYNLDNIPHLLGLVYHTLVPKTFEHRNKQQESCEFIRTAVALEEVGVKFLEGSIYCEFYVIRFYNGKLRVPRLVIDDNTESFFRNLVAYEQYNDNYSLHQVTDYLRVMDCLINSSKDVELLRHCGIIDNRIGDDAKVSTMFNQLCSGVYFDQSKFFYAEMFGQVNKFCKNPWNMRWAKLKNDYFGSPWSGISFLAALALLVLTALQTIFSGLAYYHPRS